MKIYMAVSQFPADNQMTLFFRCIQWASRGRDIKKNKKIAAQWQDIGNVTVLNNALVFIDWLTKYAAKNLSNGLETRMISMYCFGLKTDFLPRKVIFEVSFWIPVSLLEDILKYIAVLPDTKGAI